MDVPHFAHPELFEWLLADEVLDFVEAFLGPDIVLWSSHFISKPPGDGKRVPWHEDSAYWNERLSEHEVLTVWLAIDDSTRENGCMRVVADSHRHGFSDYVEVDRNTHVFGREIVAEQVDQSRSRRFGTARGPMPHPPRQNDPRLQPQHQCQAALRLHHALHAGDCESAGYGATRNARGVSGSGTRPRRQRIRGSIEAVCTGHSLEGEA